MWNPFRRREKAEQALDKELRFHVEQQVHDHMADGLSAHEARRRAQLEFGGTEQVKEACRDIRGTRWLADVVQDCRYGVRVLTCGRKCCRGCRAKDCLLGWRDSSASWR